jgi:hypothetical protein
VFPLAKSSVLITLIILAINRTVHTYSTVHIVQTIHTGEVAQWRRGGSYGGEVALWRRGSFMEERWLNGMEERWLNGSAPDYKSVVLGSNPAPPQHTAKLCQS